MTVAKLIPLLFTATAIFNTNCSTDNSRANTPIDNEKLRSKVDVNGVYIGYEEIFWTDENGVTHSSYDLDNPQDKWYRRTLLKIKGDSAFADQSAVIVKNKDTLQSSSDGGFYYWRGTVSTFDSVVTIKLTELFCDYCGQMRKKQPDGTYKIVKREKTIEGIIVSNGLMIKNFKKTTQDENLISERPRNLGDNP